VIVVLLHGWIVRVDAIVETVPVLISTWYPGRYAGEALSEAIFGLTSKACGKLPATWYKSDIVNEFNMLDFDMSRPPGRTYRYYTDEPMFPFGYGLNPLTRFHLDVKAAIGMGLCF
jgi:hypothetical protein